MLSTLNENTQDKCVQKTEFVGYNLKKSQKFLLGKIFSGFSEKFLHMPGSILAVLKLALMNIFFQKHQDKYQQ